MNYRIITDSASGLTTQIIKRFNIMVIPLTYMGEDEKVYVPNPSGDEEQLKIFYDEMRNKKSFKTSCINEDTFTKTFEEVLNSGNDLIYFSLSSGLSTTYSCAEKAASRLRDIYKDKRIYVVDSLLASFGEGLMVYTACKLKENGATIDEVYKNALDNKYNINSIFTVKNLSYLARGGRISKMSMVVGTIVDIKPLMYVNSDGKLIAYNKVIGRKRSIMSMAEKVAKTIINAEEQTIFISHGDCIEDAKLLANLIKQKVPVKNFEFNYIDAVIGSHSGPDTLAIFYYGLNREDTIKFDLDIKAI